MNKRVKLDPADIKHNTHMYNVYHSQFKMENGWHPGNQVDNFEFMMRLADFTGFPISGAKCLDVGCGTGDLSLFLRKRGVKEYLGIDIYEPSIRKAKKKYSNETFLLEDFLATPIRKKFDYAFCSGALSVKLKHTDNYEFIEATIRKMWKLTRVGIVFNFLTDDDTDLDPDLFFYKRQRIEELCEEIVGKEGKVISEKTPYIFQIHIYMFREERHITT